MSTSAMFWSRPLAGQRRRDELERLLHRVGLDVHHARLEAGGLGDGDPVLDLLLARGGDQHLRLFGIVRRRTDDLEVEVDLVERERNVLIGLGLDLKLEVLLLLARRDDDLLGDDHRGRKGERDVAVAAAQPLVGALQRVADEVEVGDVAVGDDVPDQRLDGVPLEAVAAFARFGELHQLDRRRTDVDADQGRVLRLERVEDGIEFFSEHGYLRRNADNLH